MLYRHPRNLLNTPGARRVRATEMPVGSDQAKVLQAAGAVPSMLSREGGVPGPLAASDRLSLRVRCSKIGLVGGALDDGKSNLEGWDCQPAGVADRPHLRVDRRQPEDVPAKEQIDEHRPLRHTLSLCSANNQFLRFCSVWSWAFTPRPTRLRCGLSRSGSASLCPFRTT